MKIHVSMLVVLIALSASGPSAAHEESTGATPEPASAVAEEACRKRVVEGSQYKMEDAEVTSVTGVDADRYHIDIKSPDGNYRCVVTSEGEVFSADEINPEET